MTSISMLVFVSTCATSFAQTGDLFVSFHDTDTVSLYSSITGGLLNATFASVSSPTGLTVGPDQTLYVGSDSLSAIQGAGIADMTINGTSAGPINTFVDHATDNNLNNPRGLAVVGSTLYAADLTSGNVLAYDSPGTPGTAIPNGSIGIASGLSASGGNLYIADINNGNVLRYDGVNVTQVNTVDNVFISAQDVAVGHDGNLYVLNPSQGIYQLNLATGTATKIVDYSTSFFEATALTVGPDGKLYVAGQDADAEGGVFQYNTDGTGGGIFADTGLETMPDAVAFGTPEPSTWSLAVLGISLIVFSKWRSAKQSLNHKALSQP
ncbi:MAG TPA: hypothetical protein VH413_17430 [Verrucomicrobiae bacterium]|nr:hypothetical protein [Verrucomicrobiae bacterium]